MGPRILVVDDDSDIRALVAYHLQQAGMDVTEAATGREAAQLLDRQPFSLVILDILMDEMDGLTVLQHMRAAQLTMPVILLSARQDVTDKVVGLGLGADDYVGKPFSPTELVARVQAHIRRAEGMTAYARPKALVHGDLRLEPEAQVVYKRGEPIALSLTECLLLQALMEQPAAALTKSQLYARVWGHEMYNDNVLSVYIDRLRQKIEDNPRQPVYILTVWGLGYRLAPGQAVGA